MTNMATKTTFYFPDKPIKQGYPSLFRDMLAEIRASQWLTWQLFKRNFTATYRQSVLGVFWALILPLLAVGTFIFLNSGGVFSAGDISIPYPLFAVAGVALWQVFSMGLTLGANSLVQAGAMIAKINFPRETLVLSSVAQGFIPSVVQIVVVFILFAAYQIAPPWTALLVPLAMIPLLLLTLGLALILSLINGVVRDAANGISMLVTFLMFATPILYTSPPSGIVAAVSQYNPLYYLVTVPRDLLINGSTGELPGYMYATLFSLAVFIVCWLAFHLAETRIPERI